MKLLSQKIIYSYIEIVNMTYQCMNTKMKYHYLRVLSTIYIPITKLYILQYNRCQFISMHSYIRHDQFLLQFLPRWSVANMHSFYLLKSSWKLLSNIQVKHKLQKKNVRQLLVRYVELLATTKQRVNQAKRMKLSLRRLQIQKVNGHARVTKMTIYMIMKVIVVIHRGSRMFWSLLILNMVKRKALLL